jgi:hypothetical protein
MKEPRKLMWESTAQHCGKREKAVLQSRMLPTQNLMPMFISIKKHSRERVGLRVNHGSEDGE